MQGASLIRTLVFQGQKILCVISFFLAFRRNSQDLIDWAVGPEDIVGLATSIQDVLPNSRLALAHSNPFLKLPGKITWQDSTFLRLIMGPIILGQLARSSRGVLFVGGQGYLIHSIDERAFEFYFLRSKGLKVVCLLAGSDIRSLRLMLDRTKTTGFESIADYVLLAKPGLNIEIHDAKIKKRCEVINKYADLIFTSPSDQETYLREDSKVFQPFLPDEFFCSSEDKFDDLAKPLVVHAPTSPVTKGTPLVRAAVTRLRIEGYEFDYQELQGLPNSEVRTMVRNAHVVVNELYAFVPGVLGVEALASKAVLVTRASKALDPSLPGDPGSAWIPTEPWMVYEVLRDLISNPSSLRVKARNGYDWARKYASSSTQGKRFAGTLGKLLDLK